MFSNALKIALSATFSFVLLATGGCASVNTGEKNVESEMDAECKYIQRNLTVKWNQRSYWCVPKRLDTSVTPTSVTPVLEK